MENKHFIKEGEESEKSTLWLVLVGLTGSIFFSATFIV